MQGRSRSSVRTGGGVGGHARAEIPQENSYVFLFTCSYVYAPIHRHTRMHEHTYIHIHVCVAI